MFMINAGKKMENFSGGIYNYCMNICKKKTELSIRMTNFPQNRKDFPPKARFPGNEILKFHIFTMHVKGVCSDHLWIHSSNWSF